MEFVATAAIALRTCRKMNLFRVVGHRGQYLERKADDNVLNNIPLLKVLNLCSRHTSLYAVKILLKMQVNEPGRRNF